MWKAEKLTPQQDRLPEKTHDPKGVHFLCAETGQYRPLNILKLTPTKEKYTEMKNKMINDNMGKPERSALYLNLLRAMRCDLDASGDQQTSENIKRMGIADALAFEDGSIANYSACVALAQMIEDRAYAQTTKARIKGPVRYNFESLTKGTVRSKIAIMCLSLAGVWWCSDQGSYVDGWDAHTRFEVDLSGLHIDRAIAEDMGRA